MKITTEQLQPYAATIVEHLVPILAAPTGAMPRSILENRSALPKTCPSCTREAEELCQACHTSQPSLPGGLDQFLSFAAAQYLFVGLCCLLLCRASLHLGPALWQSRPCFQQLSGSVWVTC